MKPIQRFTLNFFVRIQTINEKINHNTRIKNPIAVRLEKKGKIVSKRTFGSKEERVRVEIFQNSKIIKGRVLTPILQIGITGRKAKQIATAGDKGSSFPSIFRNKRFIEKNAIIDERTIHNA